MATGTAYVHYDSKEALLVAAFVEVKTGLGRAALHEVDLSAEPHTVFEEVWRNCHRYLSHDPPSLASYFRSRSPRSGRWRTTLCPVTTL